MLKFFLCYFTKAVIVRAKHSDVNVVIPGHETAMTRSTKQSATVGKPLDVVLLADACHLVEHVKKNRPDSFLLRRHIVAATFFCIKERLWYFCVQFIHKILLILLRMNLAICRTLKFVYSRKPRVLHSVISKYITFDKDN